MAASAICSMRPASASLHRQSKALMALASLRPSNFNPFFCEKVLEAEYQTPIHNASNSLNCNLKC